jgi:tetratricopeptide (TPR) repeat protein/transcriptional regulator with XRE-family HTH domain
MADIAAFGVRLRRCRESAGLSQEQLAECASLSIRAIRDLERGRTTHPYPATLRRLADAFALQGQARADFIAAGRAGSHLVGEVASQPGIDLPDTRRDGPGRELDRSAAVPGRPAAAPTVRSVVAAQLPRTVADFTGRRQELGRMDNLLRAVGDMPLLTIAGPPGVGKTALALHWAHRAAARYPDGQLYLNLRGYDPERPVEPDDALGQFLRALGVGAVHIPPETAARSALMRSMLAQRRVLVLLDNASSEEQVRPLLPGTASCAVVVTSRDRLAGLVARDGARRLDLGVLPMVEAVALLETLIGDRVCRDPAAAVVLAQRCARLPLALRVAAEQATARPTVRVADLADELGDDQRRLDLLDAGGDRRSGVAAVFSWSYLQLPAAVARAFRLLGIHPGREYDRYALAALDDIDLAQARRALSNLARAHLLDEYEPERFAMHDLLHSYARKLADEIDPEPARRAALTRLYDAYRHSAADAMNTLHPSERMRRPEVPPAATPVPALAEDVAAAAWLDAEHRNLIAACLHAAHHGWQGHALDIVVTIWRQQYVRGRYDDALALSNLVLPAAHAAGDGATEARILSHIASVWLRLGQPERALSPLTDSLALLRAVGSRQEEGRTLGNLGVYHARMGQLDRAADYLRQSLAIGEELGDRDASAYSLGNLAEVYRLQNRDEEALEHIQRALAIFRETGERVGESIALGNIGDMHERLGRHALAIEHLRQALSIDREIGNRSGEGSLLNSLGRVLQRMGRHTEAVEYRRRALELQRQTGNPGLQVEAQNGLGEALRATDEFDEAWACHESALAVLGDATEPREQARAYDGLAQVCAVRGDQARAGRLWQRALALYEDIGAAEADDVRERLSALADPDGAIHEVEPSDSIP